MWEDKITSRTPHADFVLAPITVACGPGCPQEGHRMRLDQPGYNDAPIFAESRVRVLHAVWNIRGFADELVREEDVSEMLHQLAVFTVCYDRNAIDSNTFYQIVNIRAQLARFVSRRLTEIKEMREVIEWANGFREGARFVREHRDQF